MGRLELLFKDEEFLHLLDLEDSKKMADFLNDSISTDITPLDLSQLKNMFKDLNIFQDIAIYKPDPTEKYKYVIQEAFAYNIKDSTINANDVFIYSDGICPIRDCTIVVGDKTVLQKHGINLYTPDLRKEISIRFKLIFLGIPQTEDLEGIYIVGDMVEIQVKKGLKDKVIEMFDNQTFYAANSSILNDIKEI